MNSAICSFIITKIMVFFVNYALVTATPDFESPNYFVMCYELCSCYNTTIDCSNRNISVLPKFISPNTTILDLSRNHIKSLPLSFFDDLLNLEVLNISYNELEELSAATNKNEQMKQLRLHTIDLSHNKIHHVRMYWQRFRTLKTLILSYNLFKEITAVTFLNLKVLEQLFLDHNQLRSLTRSWFIDESNLRNLYLNNNIINYIETGSFLFTPEVMLIDLSGNSLKFLDSGLFQELQKLCYLYLDHNTISYISEFAFSRLDQLKVLNLSSNYISIGDKEMDTVFLHLKHLEILDLSENSAFLIPSTAFQGLNNLKTLYLKYNNIMFIEEEAFTNLKSIELLELSTQSLSCGCSVKWLRDWIHLHPLNNKINVVCSSPLWLKNKNIIDVLDSEISCDSNELSSIRPKLTIQPTSTYAVRSDNISLKCAAVSLIDNMNIVWLKNNQVIDNTVNSNAIQIVDRVQYVTTSILFLKNLADTDSGTYSCQPKNIYGSDMSIKFNISVFEPPRLSKDLKSQITALSGETVYIPCIAEGQPMPVVSLTKLNYQVMHAVLDKRVLYEDQKFGITNLKIEDSGTYSCSAKNLVGVANKTIELTVLEMPKFTHPMESKEVRPGETVVLDCIVSGNPLPRLKWYKNESLLSQGLSSKIKVSNQLLIIFSFDYEDEGFYECKASNKLGTASRTARLTVQKKTLLASSPKKSSYFTVIIITVVSAVVLVIFLVLLYFFKKLCRKNKEELTDRKLLDSLPKTYTLRYTKKLSPVPVSNDFLNETVPYLSGSKDDSDDWTLDSATDPAEDDSGISLVYPKDNYSGNAIVPRVQTFSVEKVNGEQHDKNISFNNTLRSSHRKQSNCYLLFNSLDSSYNERTSYNNIFQKSLKNNNTSVVHKKNATHKNFCNLDLSLLNYNKKINDMAPKGPNPKSESDFLSNKIVL
ncbi:leucine-rich repeats and immunoglobulin-like domains protein 3 isoform X1 [Hydra vulgaris]|uniref:leucine-rich repeats and immunoglobulin-like domains protein 3 isoform X1 n=1 Tax=Hydra vulgaris TaxID=6087 RepID=UPI001F5FCBE5|nr:leucine-rich repeats and immunoglobulin-like domains protein 3 [Hydra vulgaris]